ncbi:subtilase family protein [Sediminihabitans luteus]|uniref:Subtilase family protein n=1 Tax=Sediminihabitans luteus TaxID=1138585 RepID=A0A2M9CZV2_9CELL|nr:S8 family serine peptidase [Sediminihabitans luteus]PJJ77278.1 subtilase family protein [Sediminihabitans luteus]GII98728.1 peptidase S8 [Sediminihabitans luteus]
MTEGPVDGVPDRRGATRPVRTLDPERVRRSPGRRQVQATTYVADRVIVPGTLPAAVRRALLAEDDGTLELESADPTWDAPLADVWRAADDAGYVVVLDADDLVRRSPAGQGLAVDDDADDDTDDDADDDTDDDASAGFVVRLRPRDPDVEPDAWDVVGRRPGGSGERPHLDHVMRAHRHLFPFPVVPSAEPFTTPWPYEGVEQYGQPGWGGRAPVARVGAPPRRTLADGDSPWVAADGVRRPVVAVVDTGTGTHPWLGTYDPDAPTDGPHGVVVRDALLDGAPLGTFPHPRYPAEDPEIGGLSVNPLVGPLDPVAGHGTFIAGVVHQVCPDATILSVRAFGGSGEVSEWDVTHSLRRVLEFHRRGLAGVDGCEPVDVLVLATGYYHEQAEEGRRARLRGVLRRLRRAGVLVVVSSGNDGSPRELFPAAFAQHVDRTGPQVRWADGATVPADRTPLLAVGAANPDGTTALFSNEGPWVTCDRPGAAVISTMPTTLDGPATPSRRLADRLSSGVRATIDPDGFDGGFATWSGTSFAAPVLAGELAASILAARTGGTGAERSDRDTVDAAAGRVAEAWAAVQEVLGLAPTD